ncbi:unnamed protein product [Brassica rapa]|uniref:Uncharacterized protein n=1 Tax=Brassica campestris TaxID=3711 RepID=A0A8D9D7H6_BRACM|nr:unnamed protein product [Brassica rapa]
MDQPHVGQGMHANPMNAVFIPSPVPVEVSLIEVVRITGEGTYVEAAGGVCTVQVCGYVFCVFAKPYGKYSSQSKAAAVLEPRCLHQLRNFANIRLQRFGITMEDVLLVESSMGFIRLLVCRQLVIVLVQILKPRL